MEAHRLDEAPSAVVAVAARPEGLTSRAAAERVAEGLSNTVPDVTTRSVWDILRANVLTLFNAIVAASFVLLLVLGQWRDALFGLSAVGNAVIGVVQEYRAKRVLDGLAVVSAPHARVLRDGNAVDVAVADVVLDDLLLLRAGDEVTADAQVLDAEGLEVDESLLTGEADPVAKEAGAEVLSGSSVVSGNGRARVTRVGAASFASRLTTEAKRFSLVTSEIRNGLNRVLRWIAWALVPVMIIVVNGEMQALGGWGTAISTGRWTVGAVSAVASVIAMVPLGLVMLTSVALAVGGVRLARQKVLVRELAAVEGLARVDMLCLDKTGTLTEGTLAFDAAHMVAEDPAPGWRAALGWFASEPNANATARCLAAGFPDGGDLEQTSAVPFSSVRKWSAVQFPTDGEAGGSWVLGAPELIIDDQKSRAVIRASEFASAGQRTLLLAATTTALRAAPAGARLPSGLRPVVLLTFREEVRPDARQTIDYFRRQGVQIRILSGDAPRTVAAVARQVGLDPGDGYDARDLPEDDAQLGEVLRTHTVFGRVTPAQKRRVVATLQSLGHVVAMTGDGVNDIPALKAADMGIAMNTAAAATRAVARLVLLDGRFERLPHVVAEGRRVIANVERVSMLFLAKTVYSFLLSLTFGALLWGFPFLPRQLSMSDGLTIGIPAFFLALMANPRRYRSGFLKRSLSFAIPAGAITTAALAGVRVVAQAGDGADAGVLRTVSVLTLSLIGLWILVVVSRPLDLRRALVVACMYGGLGLVLTVPIASDFFALKTLPPPLIATAVGAALAAVVLLEILARLHRRWSTESSGS